MTILQEQTMETGLEIFISKRSRREKDFESVYLPTVAKAVAKILKLSKDTEFKENMSTKLMVAYNPKSLTQDGVSFDENTFMEDVAAQTTSLILGKQSIVKRRKGAKK